jgi:hypothetical protein
VEARLNEAGIMNLGQLARTPVNELSIILTGLPGRFDVDRIAREGWVAHAAEFATPTTPSPSAQPEASQAAAGSAAADASPPGLLAPIVGLRPDRMLLHPAQPFAVTLSLDLTKVAPQSERLIYSAVIIARQLGEKSSRTLASPRGLLKVAGTTTITIDAGGLPPGIYLLEAAVSLRAAGSSHGGVAAMAEGIMVHVLPP